MLRVGLCGGVTVEADGRRLPDTLLAGRQGRLVLAYLVCERHRSVPREQLAELLWGEPLPSSWSASLSAVVSKLRRLLTEAGLDGAAALASAFGSYRIHLPEDAWVDWEAAAAGVERAEAAVRGDDAAAAVAAAAEAEEIARRGFLADDCLWVDAQRERLRDLHVRAVQARAEAHLMAGDRGRAVSAAREALALDDVREVSYRLLMQALAAAGERGEALRVWERCRVLLGEELGADPAPETEAVYLSILGPGTAATAPPPTPADVSLPSGVVTFLLTDIVESSGLWERNPTAMAAALERHDQLVSDTVEAHGGVLLKAKLEGDATVSVFPRASAGVAAAMALRRTLTSEAWPDGAAPAVRMALHTGEAIERDGDYFGPALNRAARLRSLARGGQILASQTVADVVRDHLPVDTALRSLGEHQLRGLIRGEHVFELVAATTDDGVAEVAPLERPPVPAMLAGRGLFVGRGTELDRLATEWATSAAGTARALFIAGEPGVGKTRLAAEWARQAHQQGALVLYGRCDEELGAPYQPFAEALRAVAPHLGADRLRAIRGIEQVSRLVPELGDIVPGLPAASQADPDTERYLLFDAVARLFGAVSAEAPVLVMIDDLQWAAKPTLLLLRHLLRSGDGIRLQIVGTYRSTDLNRTHPLAGVLADLHRDGSADRLILGGLDEGDVGTYLRAAGHDDAQLSEALSTVTSGNPFFLIEVVRHVEETGGAWDPKTLPQGVREAVGRRLSRLSDLANDSLHVGAVAGSRFSLELVEKVLERDLVDAVDEARHAGLLVEEPGNQFRFNHALVRQSLLSELASVKRVRLHQRIAAVLEADEAATDDAHLAELARHYFECAFAGGAAKAVDYSRRAGEQAMARLAYEEAADLYDQALQAADVDGSACTDHEKAELLLARCEALLAAGDPSAAAAVIDHLQRVARSSPQLSAWATCFAGQLAVLIHPERLDATAQDVAAAAEQFAQIGDAEGEAKAHTVRASCLARLGRVADCEAALDRALTAGRRAGNPRRVNAVLAGAPLAALWGPSPVARASGRCLDVVRVLRITTGSPAVEAVALRCQALLEALRGRTDAARRMLGSARRSLESLGHTHGLLETDVFSGTVALYAGDAVEAEIALRRAYDGFVARGVGVDAAQAAALLARAVLAQGRVEEALTLTEDSERLSGVDLKAAIAWRAARAEALARLGRTAEALDAARSAVALADPTDALIDQADAHLSLAVVLHAAGNGAEAEREAGHAADLYERKGATARVEAVGAIVETHPIPAPSAAVLPSRRRVRTNRASECLKGGPLDAEHIARWIEELAGDFGGIDHRMHLAEDRDVIIASWHSMAVGGRASVESTVLATLGDRHCITRYTWRSGDPAVQTTVPGPAEVTWLNVLRAAADGRVQYMEQYQPDDLPLALARLIELHAEDELPPARRDAHAIQAETYREQRLRWSDDAVIVDHRPASLGILEGQGAISSAGAALRGLVSDIRWRITDVLAFSERASVLAVLSEGSTEDGGLVEMPLMTVNESNEHGFLCRCEWYPPDHVEEALARFDELTAADRLVRRRVRPNAVTAALTARTSPSTPLATQGERHALVRAGEGGSAVFELLRANDDGNLEVVERFDAGHLHLGLARLIEIHADEELPLEQREKHRVTAAQVRNQHTWWSDDAVLVDHRSASLGTLVGRDAIAAAAGALRELAGGLQRRIVDVLGWRTGRWSLLELMSAGSTDDGGPVEFSVFSLNEVGDDGLVHRQEWFGPDQLDEALARFDEVADRPPEDRLTNEATRLGDHIMECTLSGDWAALAAATAEDAVLDDRRPVIGYRYEGRDLIVAQAETLVRMGFTSFELNPIATRGERLVLQTLTARGDYGEAEMLEVSEFGADGLWLGNCVFDAKDLDAAFDELDARYAAGEAAPFADAWVGVTGRIAAYNARDWDGLTASFSENFEFVDHRPGGWGTLDRHAYVGTMAGLFDVVADARARIVRVLRPAADAIACLLRVSGTDEFGGEFEFELIHVQLGGGNDGLGHHAEWFSADDTDAALARFDELTTPQEAGYRQNDATRRWAELVALFRVCDWDALAARVSTRAVHEDRRSVVGGLTYPGRESLIELWRSGAAVGVAGMEWTVLATRGQRLGLTRALLGGETGESEILFVQEFDEDGLYLGGVAFDPDDLDAAFDELDARFAAGDAAPFRNEWAVWTQFTAAYQARDWDRLEALHTEDFVCVDHRAAGFGTMERSEYIRLRRELVELSPDVRLQVAAVPRVASGGMLGLARLTGRDQAGSEFEIEWLAVGIFAGPRIRRIEFFADDDLPAAMARLDEVLALEGVLANAAVRRMTGFAMSFCARAWDALTAQMSEDVEKDDRRPVVGGIRYPGRDAMLDLCRAIATMVTEVPFETVATRGDRLALLRVVYRGAGFEVETLEIFAVDDEGLLVLDVAFDPQDLDAAFAELDARYLAGEAAPFAATWAAVQAPLRAYEHRDWEALRLCLTPDFRLVDHRPAGWGELDADGYIALLREMVDLVPDLHNRMVGAPRINGHGGVGVLRAQGTDQSGAEVELARASLAVVRGDQLSRVENFAIDDLDAALVRFDELCAQPPDPEPDMPGEPVATRGDRLHLVKVPGGGYRVVDRDESIPFGADALAAAVSELEDRYAARLPPEQADAWRGTRELVDAYNARAAERLRGLLAEDCVIVDERVTGWGTLDRDQFVAHLQQLVDMAPDAFLLCVAVHTLTPHGSVGRFRVSGTVPGGGEFEMLFETMSVVSKGRIVRLELLPDGRPGQ